ncbi:MAG: ABC transporter permease subunit [Acidobacteriota bacterium]
MIFILTKKEILEDIYNIRFIILVLLCSILIPLTLFINQKALDRDIIDYYQTLTKYEEKLKSGSHNTLTFEASGFRPPSELRIFSIGLDTTLPSSIIITRDEGIKSGENKAEDSPYHAFLGKIDFLFIIKVVMSLVAMIFTFNAISGEKEQGTIRQILSNSIHRYKIVIAKYLGNFIILLFPFILGLTLGLLIVITSSDTQLLSSNHLLRIIFMFLIALIYISLFLNLGLFISVITKRSWTSIVFLLFIWVIFVHVIPQISGMIAETLYPVKSVRVLNIEKDIQKKSIEKEQSKELQEIFMKNNYDELRKPIVEKYKKILAERLRNIDQEHKNRKRVQRIIANTISRTSPSSSLTFIFSELSNTGILEMENFITSALQFQNLIEANVYADTYTDDVGSGMSVKLGAGDFSNIPRFNYRKVEFVKSILSIQLDLFLLILFNALLFSLSAFLFITYDVR